MVPRRIDASYHAATTANSGGSVELQDLEPGKLKTSHTVSGDLQQQTTDQLVRVPI